MSTRSPSASSSPCSDIAGSPQTPSPSTRSPSATVAISPRPVGAILAAENAARSRSASVATPPPSPTPSTRRRSDSGSSSQQTTQAQTQPQQQQASTPPSASAAAAAAVIGAVPSAPTLDINDLQSVLTVLRHPLSSSEHLSAALAELQRVLQADAAGTAPLPRAQLNAAVKALMTPLAHSVDAVRSAALDIVVAMSAHSSPALHKQLLYENQVIGRMRIILSTDNAPASFCIRAATVLGNLSKRDGGAWQTAVVTGGTVPHLLGMLDSSSEEVVLASLRTLEALLDGSANVQSAMRRENAGAALCRRVAPSGNMECVLLAIRALAHLAMNGNEFGQLDRLSAVLQSPDVAQSVRDEATKLHVQITERAAAASTNEDFSASSSPEDDGRVLRRRSDRSDAVGRSPPRRQPVTPSKRFAVGVSETVGRRKEMEDAFLVCGAFRSGVKEELYAVFDGHGGKDAAEFSASRLHAMLLTCLNERALAPADALRETFAELNRELGQQLWSQYCGATALVALFQGRMLYVANVGDTRAVLCSGGAAVRLSHDHKPQSDEETGRIMNLGGMVRNKRVNGILAVSRALGDSALQPLVSSEPHITERELDFEKDEFIIIACDGLWDVISDEDAVQLAKQCANPGQVSATLRDRAIALGSNDNVSVICVYFSRDGVKASNT